LTRFQVSKHLRVSHERFCNNDAPLPIDRVRLSGVPRRHQYYEGAKTSCAEYEVAYGFASSLQSFFSTFCSLQRRGPQGMARFISPRASGPHRVGRNTGPPRFLGNPSSYLCPALGPRSVWRASPLRLAQCCPQHLKNEDTNGWFISRLNHTASVPAAYASSSALPHSHARLASGWWLAFTGRESNPLDSNDWFPSPTTSSNPRLRLALSKVNCNTCLV
jgi:hypothetical protein